MSSTRKTANADSAQAEAPDRAAIEAQIARVRTDIAELGQMLKAAGHAQLQGARDTAEQLPEEALAELQAQIRALEAQARARMAAQPLQTLGLAAMAGFLVGLILRR
ncbi:MAG: hypothetical protein JJU19_05030 [Pararhodobacter sp.]|nr:hypothetical protein [Pararhodobacter sp.]